MSTPMDTWRFGGAQGGDFYASLNDYLGARAHDRQASLSTAITAINRERRDLAHSKFDDDVSLRGDSGPDYGPLAMAAKATPWPTFVLGSGCLNSPDWKDERAEMPPELADAVAEVVRELGAAPLLATLTTDFIGELARTRTDQQLGIGALVPSEPRTAAEWHFIALVCTAARLATRAYAAALGISPHALTRAEHEIVRLRSSSLEWARLHRDAVQPLMAAIDELVALLASDEEQSGARASLHEVLTGMGPDIAETHLELRRAHVELLTAHAWLFLTESTNVYPGWSDLLLFEAFDDANNIVPPAFHDTALRPSSSFGSWERHRDSWLIKRLRAVTETSWHSRFASDADTAQPTRRDEFYDAVASILHLQASDYYGYPPEGSATFRPPLPVCVVTSFDIELEMALWAKCRATADADLPGPRSFIVVLPVVASSTRRSGVSLHWVWRKITPTGDSSPEAQLGELTGEVGARWNEVTDATDFLREASTWGDIPIVVRMAGSPLMRVDDENTDLTVTGRSRQFKDVRQALLLDEYTAMSETALDLVEGSGGLPLRLLGSNSAYMPRYWVFLGVQLGDGAIRLRLLAHELANLRKVGPTAPRPNGIAVNLRSRKSERDLFHWYGVDVVEDSHDKLIEPLQRLNADLADAFDGFAQWQHELEEGVSA